MRRHILLALVLAQTALSILSSRSLPLTLKDVMLMLRSGYSSQSVQQELSARRFAETLDEAAEKALRDAGASPALIEAIKNGSYESSAEDAQAAREQLATQSVKQALENDRLRKMEAFYQDQRSRQRATVMPQTGSSTFIADFLKGDLIYWKNGSVARFDDVGLDKKKIFALYFSAYWCGPCRKFTPQFAEFYNRFAPQHPEFETIFISEDHSPFGMETYLSKMPWPAIEFAKLPNKEALKKYAGDAIPCLVVVDASGKVLFDTYAGKNRLGPEQVLAALETNFAKGPVAAAR